MSFAITHCTSCGQVHNEGPCPPDSTELDRRVVHIINHTTGALVDLDGSNDHLVEALQGFKRAREFIRDRERIVEQVLLGRLDEAANWTMHTSAGKVSAPSPAPLEEYDGMALRTDLLELVDEGVLSIEAVDKACPTEVSVKVSKRGIGALVKLGGKVAEAVAAHRRTVAPRRYVRVSS